jgi:hypothetical protein
MSLRYQLGTSDTEIRILEMKENFQSISQGRKLLLGDIFTKFLIFFFSRYMLLLPK